MICIIMMLRSFLLVRLGLVLSCSSGTFGLIARAQTSPALSVELYAGLTITGSVGRVYSIEYVPHLALTNTASAWRCVEYLQLPTSPFLWTDSTLPGKGSRFYRAVLMQPPTNLVFIPPGTFRMGSATNEVDRVTWEGPQTLVTISRGFWLGRYEVTQRDYISVIGSNPSLFVDLNRPVERVSWHDATNYCAVRTGRERAAGLIAGNCVYRLPTEAEWEYSCRAWTSTRFSYGDDSAYAELAKYAFYFANSTGTSQPVGQRLPNPWGLYDMHGNVYEWCQDWWADFLPGGIVMDPQGPMTGTFRVICGGFYFSEPQGCRSAYRLMSPFPTSKSSTIGFRVVLAPGQP